ncbi:MAG TPA: carbohydrate ABC transporter permease, partial [Alicyclobacillus sp.]|nr:carbohydrate ABC transporter permease [Alicyclobacillus sp.]
MSKVLAAGFRVVVLIVYTLFSVFPLFYMILNSFKSDADTFTTFVVFRPTLDNYRAVFGDGTFVHALGNTLVVSALAVAVALVVGVPTAYALARFTFKGREDIAFTILSFRFAPGLLIAMPLYVIYQHIGLFDSVLGLVWVYQLIALPLIVWVLRSYFEGVSIEVEQAAHVDGYTRLGAFWKIVLPLIRPGLVASALLAF